jgi:glycosyltransferase involved in cell wall biosynthesis
MGRPVIIFYTEYKETLDLFFSETIKSLERLGIIVLISASYQDYLFDTPSSLHGATLVESRGIRSRFMAVFMQIYKNIRQYPNALHVYVLPIHIILAPLIFTFARNSFSIVSQGQLEGEGILVSTIYRIILSFAARFSVGSFSCNIVETFGWYIWPFSYLSAYLKPLPWYGLTLSPGKIKRFTVAKSESSFNPGKRPVFGYLGRLCGSKGCINLLDHFSHPSLSSYSLKMTGPIEKDFADHLRGCQSDLKNITLLPPVDPNMVVDWFSGIDIYITLSRGESIGAASVEALLAGKPVISLINSGSCQVLRHCVDSYIIQSPSLSDVQIAIEYVILNYESMSRSAAQIGCISFPRIPLLATELACLSSSCFLSE